MKQHRPTGAVWVCVRVSHLIFLPRPDQLQYQGAIKYKFFETLKLLKNKGENKNKEVKEEEKKLAFGGTYNLKQALDEKIIRQSIICIHIPT